MAIVVATMAVRRSTVAAVEGALTAKGRRNAMTGRSVGLNMVTTSQTRSCWTFSSVLILRTYFKVEKTPNHVYPQDTWLQAGMGAMVVQCWFS